MENYEGQNSEKKETLLFQPFQLSLELMSEYYTHFLRLIDLFIEEFIYVDNYF